MSEKSEKVKQIATFQTDQAVRRKILNLIKRKPPKSSDGSNEVPSNKRPLYPETEGDLDVTRPIKVMKTYGRLDQSGRHASPPDSSQVEPHLRVQCSICGQMYNSAPLLDKHVKRVHLKEKRHLCQFCDFRAFYRREVILHEQRVHLKEQSVKCPFCDYTTTDNQSLYSHLSTHSNNKAFTCDLCPYTCGWRKQLTRHAQAHASPQRVTCALCGIVSRDKKQDLVHYSVEHTVRTTVNMGRLQVAGLCMKKSVCVDSQKNPTQQNSSKGKSIGQSLTTSSTYQEENGIVYGLRQDGILSSDPAGSQGVMLTNSSLGTSLAHLLSMDNASFRALSNGAQKNKDPQLIISRDEVADHFQVLNVSDLVRKQERVMEVSVESAATRSCVPETMQIKPQLSNEFASEKPSVVSNSESKPRVSRLKSVLRSDVKEKLLAASQRASASLAQRGPPPALIDSSRHQENGRAMSAQESILGGDFSTTDFMNPSVKQGTDLTEFFKGVDLGAGSTDPDIDVIGSDTEPESWLRPDIASPASVEMPKVELPENSEEWGENDVTEGANNLDYIEQELQSFIEKIEEQNAAAQESKNVIYINSADIQEIISIIENKMNGDNHQSTANEPQHVECDPEQSIKPSGETQLQVVLQVPGDVDSPSGSHGDGAPSGGTPVASVELSVVDQILKNLLQSKNETSGKITVLNSDSDKVFKINLPS